MLMIWTNLGSLLPVIQELNNANEEIPTTCGLAFLQFLMVYLCYRADGWLPGVMPRWCYQTLWTDYKVVPQNKPKTLIKIWRPLIKANLFEDKLHSWKALELYHLLSYHFPETSFFIEIFVFKANWKANIGSLCLKPRKISEAIAGWFEVINLAYIAAFKFSKATQKNIGYF